MKLFQRAIKLSTPLSTLYSLQRKRNKIHTTYHRALFGQRELLMASSSSSETTTNDSAANSSDIKIVRIDDLYIKTPFMKSEPLTKLLSSSSQQRDVFIKLDNLQRSGSYKDRGMANLLYNFSSRSNANSSKGITKIVCSSGGNAGLAAALVAKDLQLHCTVVVPKTTKQMVIDKLRTLYNAHVIVTGANWNEADGYAKQLLSDDTSKSTLYVPPYDHPLLWTGISSIIDEIYTTNFSMMKEYPSTIVLSVGGGGLLCGILEGLQNISNIQQQEHSEDCNKSRSIPMPNIFCCETDGTNSFAVSWNEQSMQSLQQITSIATSLGALSVTPVALQRSMEYHNNRNHTGTISSALCTDAEAIDACIQFARDHRMLVEPACGAALAMIYSERLRQQHFGTSFSNRNTGPIVIEICGGNGVNIDLLNEWKKEFIK